MGAEPATFLFLARPSREAQGAHCSGITVPRKGGSLNRQREGSAQGADGVPGGREGERRGVGTLPLRLMGGPNASLAGTGALEPERDVVAMARTHFTHPQPHSSDKQFVLCTYEHFYFLRFHIRETTRYLPFSASLCTMPSRSTHVVAHGRLSLFFMAE